MKKLKEILPCLLLTLAMIFNQTVFGMTATSGTSMEPTIPEGRTVIVNHRAGEYKRGDIVVAKVRGLLVIKRIIGGPGDSIIFQSGYVYVNGRKSEYGTGTTSVGDGDNQVNLSENEYYLLGDNREHSIDSRTYGPVTASVFRGKVVAIFPF